jgi:hypothetical protein
MFRAFVVAFVMSCFAVPAWAQVQPAPAASPTGAHATKPAAKKPAAKAKTIAKRAGPIESGPCRIGVIPAIGNQFAVQKIGLMVFGNEHAEVPIDAWALDDLVVARVRAAVAPGTGVRRIAYAKGAFEPYDNPPAALFRNPQDNLTSIVRQITANASCERYLVVTKYTGKLDGTNQTLRGVGVFNHGTSLLSRTSLFANILVTVFDGQTFAIHKSPFGLGSVLAGTFARMGRNPLTELDNASFPEPVAAAANSAILRDRTRALVTANLDKTLSAYLKAE